MFRSLAAAWIKLTKVTGTGDGEANPAPIVSDWRQRWKHPAEVFFLGLVGGGGGGHTRSYLARYDWARRFRRGWNCFERIESLNFCIR